MSVWIDTDMGFDDIVAILIAARGPQPIDGVSLVFGNTSLAQVRHNAAAARAVFGWSFPIHTGRALPVLAPLETAESILGQQGMPTAGLSLPEDAPPLPLGCAFTALCDWLASAPAPRRVLALGPLTNLAALALARPDLAARIDDLIWMGGGVTLGNHTASAEFNAFADPEALAIVLAQGLPLRMVDLDLCRQVVALPAEAERLRAAGGRNAALLADLLAGFINIGTSRGRPGMSLYDPCAAVALVDETIIRFTPARIGAELSGLLTRGRTVVDPRPSAQPHNAAYASEVDAEAALRVIMDALISEAAQ